MQPPEPIEAVLTDAALRRLPVGYRLMQPDPSGATAERAAESAPYRARAYGCEPARKPVSRCLSLRDP